MIKMLFVVFLLITAFFGVNNTVKAENDSLVISLSGENTASDITITAQLKKNTGISSMLLELSYNTSTFEFISYERKTALSEMTLVPTGNIEVKPFFFHYMSNTNDYSTGAFLVMHFKVLKTAKEGQYLINFKYRRDCDVECLVNDNLETMTKNIVFEAAKISVNDSKINIIPFGTDETSTNDNIGMIFLAITISTVLIIGGALLLITKKRNSHKKKGWKKL